MRKSWINIFLFYILLYCSVPVYATTSDTICLINEGNDKTIKHFALLIGNQNYPEGGMFTKLTNPIHDVDDLGEILCSYNYQVVILKDIDGASMKKRIRNFTEQLPKNSVALFYFSGHGTSVNQENYIIPTGRTDFMFTEKDDILYEAIDLKFILEQLEKSQADVKLIILDSCRDQLNLQNAKSSTNEGGFIEPIRPSGTIIAYATALNKTAKGNPRSRNSIYTQYLLKVLREEQGGNIDINAVLRKVANSVADVTNKEQVPWHSEGLIGGQNFCLDKCVNNINFKFNTEDISFSVKCGGDFSFNVKTSEIVDKRNLQLSLPFEMCTITAEKAGYKKFSNTINFDNNSGKSINVELSPEESKLLVKTNMANTKITIFKDDNSPILDTVISPNNPLEKLLPNNRYVIKAETNGYITKSFIFVLNQSHTVEFDLKAIEPTYIVWIELLDENEKNFDKELPISLRCGKNNDEYQKIDNSTNSKGNYAFQVPRSECNLTLKGNESLTFEPSKIQVTSGALQQKIRVKKTAIEPLFSISIKLVDENKKDFDKELPISLHCGKSEKEYEKAGNSSPKNNYEFRVPAGNCNIVIKENESLTFEPSKIQVKKDTSLQISVKETKVKVEDYTGGNQQIPQNFTKKEPKQKIAEQNTFSEKKRELSKKVVRKKPEQPKKAIRKKSERASPSSSCSDAIAIGADRLCPN